MSRAAISAQRADAHQEHERVGARARGAPSRCWLSSFVGSSWPVITANDDAMPRCVTGIPAYAGAAIADVTPGMTSNGTPAAASASASSPPRPKTNGSPPFSRTTRLPARALLDEQRVDLVLRQRVPIRRLARVDQLCVRPRVLQAAPDSPAGRTRRHPPRRAARRPPTVISAGSPGPAPTSETSPGIASHGSRVVASAHAGDARCSSCERVSSRRRLLRCDTMRPSASRIAEAHRRASRHRVRADGMRHPCAEMRQECALARHGDPRLPRDSIALTSVERLVVVRAHLHRERPLPRRRHHLVDRKDLRARDLATPSRSRPAIASDDRRRTRRRRPSRMRVSTLPRISTGSMSARMALSCTARRALPVPMRAPAGRSASVAPVARDERIARIAALRHRRDHQAVGQRRRQVLHAVDGDVDLARAAARPRSPS